MHWGPTAWVQLAAVVIVLGALHVPLGNYMARVYTDQQHWRIERILYRLIGADPDREQHWKAHLASVLAFSAVSIIGLFALLLAQTALPPPWGHPAMTPLLALNTAISFATNTSWQNYAGEATLGHVGLAAGLGVQAFASAAVGMAVAVALIRGISRRQTQELGNFWVDLIRSIVRILLPIAALIAVALIGLGVVQSWGSAHMVNTLAGGTQTLPIGPVASWESIKLMSGDGGGAFNANSAHPLENPSGISNILEIITMALIPASLIRTYGVMVGDRRQGWALLAVVAALFALGTTALSTVQTLHHGTVPTATGTATEGTEVRFGAAGTALFGQVATATADGAANGSYDSFTSLGGAVLMANMMLGEVSPGGAGSGLYGLLLIVFLTVFLGGLMIGRTPEYLGKRLRPREMKRISATLLVAPLTVLTGVAISITVPAGPDAMTNTGPHGLSELLYAFTSCVAGNGSAFAGFTGNTAAFNVGLGLAMLIGRYLPMILILMLAASLAAQQPATVTIGTLRTHAASFIALAIGVAIIVVGLEYLPALTLGPIADAVSHAHPLVTASHNSS